MTTNLTRNEAQSRTQLLEVDAYTVHIDVSNAETDDDTYYSRTVVDFTARFADSTFIDLIADSVSSVQVNGQSLSPAEVFDGARVTFPVRAGRNSLTIEARARYSTSGEGLHRFTDPADGRVYLYTQYEPTDARRVFANFDQPDLKAEFVFTVTAPAHFQVLSNRSATRTEPADGSAGAASAGSNAATSTGSEAAGSESPAAITHYFEPTLKQSSYITCITAGPYEGATDEWTDPRTGQTVQLGAWTRASLVEHLDADDIFGVTKAGLDFFTSEFDYPYPWGKYDQIFVPEYNLGAMENPGLVTFTDTLIFRDKVTDANYESRANVILHEMAHMWFGDLVTMKWWDDLWLKESFADFMGGLALAEATRFSDGWVTFALRRKAWAYTQDLYPTTHPIVADIPDVEAAKLNFDGITYAKGASVLKQLVAFVGREAFFAGSRLYFKRFEYGNTELADFLECLAEAAPDRDIANWAAAWLGTSGVSELSLQLTTSDGSAESSVGSSAGSTESSAGSAESSAGSAGSSAGSAGVSNEGTSTASDVAAQSAGAGRLVASSSGARLRSPDAVDDSFDGTTEAEHEAGTGEDRSVQAPRRRSGAEKVTGATITQADSAEGTALLRPHTIEIATLGRSGRAIVPLDSFRFEFSTESAEVEQLIGRSAGVITLLNYNDLDYARVRLDPESMEAAITSASRITDPLSRALVWSALDNAVRDGLMPVQKYLTAYARSLGKESHAGIMAGLSQTALTCIDQWVADRNFDAAITGLLGAALDALAAARAGSDAQLHLANLVLALTSRTARWAAGSSAVAMGRGFASQILTVPVGEEIDRMYPDAPGQSGQTGRSGQAGQSGQAAKASGSARASRGAEHSTASLPFRGLIIDHALRWNALTALVSLGWADQTDIARENHSDPSSSGRLHAETASAALPLPIVKIRAWEAIREAGALSNDVLSAIIAGFIAPSALPLIEEYVDEYFDGLLGFWTDNSIEIARRLVLGLYPRWSVDEEAVVEKTDAWLAANIDAPAALRRLVIERRDDLARAIFLKSTQSSRH
ncbi:aminopeptidase N [Brevibacterium limosum]|uniref:aminopeptidase N n=1 Tax=Brevibacterium limosum TaxID=2697565 RepID=UPI00141FF77F|nr:aminopeptidase N [Brevibacterium limosum]